MIRLGHLTKREGYMPDQLESIIESPEAQLLKDGFVFTEGHYGTPTVIGYLWIYSDPFRQSIGLHRKEY